MKSFHLGLLRCCAASAAILATSTTLLAQTLDDVPVDALLSQAQTIFSQIDARNAEAVWDSASLVMRKASKKEEFVARIERDRAEVSHIAGRTWQSITRTVNTEASANRIPPGNYISINSLAQDGGGRLMHELITFRLEEDRKWRMTGYVSQKVVPK